ncbi:N-acetyltransferase [Chloropicon primus]|uniref:N-acetyltransferase n=1 Tax=Chloropicon primus TaxID=1764295 RepID=A0A5B8MJK9_9CHLO|nr:N-acetyltransferase [Chloropicon primus]UPQ99810.1 N-acetyltransferase [Chloropicon primus]|mmetsp:Transcript_5753/g.17404  ORF Transcript_5753/g.17404 Transcript_5753/m.17404 type:complete len:179 (-) Transcript_5753:375-911(-)|eukprot:QDZ20599.1 N-acetyltransferase [Chloropicon primus]
MGEGGSGAGVCGGGGVRYRTYEKEEDLGALMGLVDKELSEPYSIFTYRYFVYDWPQLCFLAVENDADGKEQCVGALVCKADTHKQHLRGYVAMLVVERRRRKQGIAKDLVKMAIERMVEEGCAEIVLEAEVSNKAALNLYAKFGFIRDKRLYRYYLTGTDAYRLKLSVAPHLDPAQVA